jgi:K+-transporting ATPase ATPase C chain
MLRIWKTAFGLLAVMTLITGVVYPLLVTAVAQLAFPRQANGDRTLIGRAYDDPKYVWGRLSATAPNAYNAMASTGSNLGPTNDQVTKNAEARIDALRAADPDNHAPIPVDLVTSSASGLDPHISPAAAHYQAQRIARARGIPVEKVRAIIEGNTQGRALGILGEPTVNVVLVNTALDTP